MLAVACFDFDTSYFFTETQAVAMAVRRKADRLRVQKITEELIDSFDYVYVYEHIREGIEIQLLLLLIIFSSQNY